MTLHNPIFLKGFVFQFVFLLFLSDWVTLKDQFSNSKIISSAWSSLLLKIPTVVWNSVREFCNSRSSICFFLNIAIYFSIFPIAFNDCFAHKINVYVISALKELSTHQTQEKMMPYDTSEKNVIFLLITLMQIKIVCISV